ncbi:restriction endonuclease subunit S [Streptococcus caprae]|uniref:Restriction endonuclease subunit S n=1 Tax=Streptococcus caprae TaxID=1640501 RepID=A0ABV8CW24_9STRE
MPSQPTKTWEKRQLGEVAEINPKSVLPEEFEYIDLESVVGTELVSHRSENLQSAPSRAQRLAQKGDIFYQTVRPYQKNNYYFDRVEENFVFSTGYAQIRTSNDGRFIFTSIQTDNFVTMVLNSCTGTSYPAINSSDLAKILFYLPTHPEQTAIGNLFSQLDRAIALQECLFKRYKLPSILSNY